jgi:hypothetical protein
MNSFRIPVLCASPRSVTIVTGIANAMAGLTLRAHFTVLTSADAANQPAFVKPTFADQRCFRDDGWLSPEGTMADRSDAPPKGR